MARTKPGFEISRVHMRCDSGAIGGLGECLFCDADQGQACRLTDEDNCPGHVAHRFNRKLCGRCGVHIDSLRPLDNGQA